MVATRTRRVFILRLAGMVPIRFTCVALASGSVAMGPSRAAGALGRPSASATIATHVGVGFLAANVAISVMVAEVSFIAVAIEGLRPISRTGSPASGAARIAGLGSGSTTRRV